MRKISSRVLRTVILTLICMLATTFLQAQPPAKKYTVRNGRMYIELGRLLSEQAVDSFITQYSLSDIALKHFFRGEMLDSLIRAGWKLEQNDSSVFIISKAIEGFGKFENPSDKILVAGKSQQPPNFPVVSSNVRYGFNKFRNKLPFAEKDSFVTFYLRNFLDASRVVLSGSFINWSPTSLPMVKTDSGWILTIALKPGKYWYKFIIDGNWRTDPDNLQNENDGLGNMNSVMFKSNHVFQLAGYDNARKVYVAGSFNDWREKDLPMVKTGIGWRVALYLADGTHTYRFIADNRWMTDPANPDKLPNEFNDYNSVIRFGKPYVFHLDGFTDATTVVLSGSFNNWRRDELYMKKSATGWDLPYNLGPGNYEYNFIIDGKRAASGSNPAGRGNFFFVIEPNYTFRLKGFPNARSVYLAGSFNNWSPNSFAMERQGDEWVFSVHLSPGKQLYKFVVDGKWIIDPGNKLWEQNEHNTGNSVLWISDGQVR